jgi:hypothetical protein
MSQPTSEPPVILEMRAIGENTKSRYLGPFGSEALARNHAESHLRGYAWTVHRLHPLVRVMPTVRSGKELRDQALASPAARSISVGPSIQATLTRAETDPGDDIVDAEVVDP